MKPWTIFLFYILDEIIVGIVAILLMYYYTNWNLVIGGGILLILIIFLTVMFYVFLPQFKRPQTGKDELMGLYGIAIKRLDPHGQIKVRGEIWRARSLGSKIEKGKKVKIVDIDGLELLVKKSK